MNQKKKLTRGGGLFYIPSLIWELRINIHSYSSLYSPLSLQNVTYNWICVFVLFWGGGGNSAPWDWNLKTPTKQQKWQIF